MDTFFAWLPLLAENNLHYALIVAAILTITVTLLLRTYRYQRRQKRGGSTRLPASQAGPDPRGLRAAAPDSIVRWEVEMQELARDLKAEIDSKMVALGHLVRDADRAANRLEKALTAMDDPNIHPDQPPEQIPSTAESDGSDSSSLREEIYLLADYGFSVADIASRLATPTGQIELTLRLREKRE